MFRRTTAVLAAATLFFSIMASAGAENQTPAFSDNEKASFFEAADAIPMTTTVDRAKELLRDTEPGIYLVRLADPAVAAYGGGIEGLAATSPVVTGVRKLDPDSRASRAYRAHLVSQQDLLISRMEGAFGRAISPRFEYFFANNGLAVFMSPEEAARVVTMPGVASVERDKVRQLHTDAGPAWINAPHIWNPDGPPVCVDSTGTQSPATGTPPPPPTTTTSSTTTTTTLPPTPPSGFVCGEGILVGVLDTGIQPTNPSFAAVGGDGFVHTNPFGSGTFVGVCDPTEATFDPTFPCNNKLVGAWNFTASTGPWDDDGHGSHTASTAAGNFVTPATVVAPTVSIDRNISGVAPHANLIMYDVCVPSGCGTAGIVAAIDQAILDGVDVINFSIGGGAQDPWSEADSVAFLSARASGIFVATSAGNEGPGPDTVGSPAVAPWLTSVGASTHNRTFNNILGGMTGGDSSPPADIVGKGFTSGFGPAPIVYAGDFGDALCLDPFPAGTFSGEIVVCDRGQIARVQKGQNVLDGGAGGYVLANDLANGDSLVTDPHFLPGVHITYDDGVILKTWLASGSGHTATISGAVLNTDAVNGDVMAAFSSRGANVTIDTIVPNVTAPGVDVLAALGDSGGTGPGVVAWGLNSGTSMSSPHTAGAGALLMQAHPDWTPAEIQSALMTSAHTGVLNDDGTAADPFDMGSGRIDLWMATKAGLVFDESIEDYLAADPAVGGDPKTINLASMANSQCLQVCSWTRTAESTLAEAMEWTVSVQSEAGLTLTVTPSTFTIGPGGTQDIAIEADVTGSPTGDWLFGAVTLTPTTAGMVAEARLPVAVIPSTGVFPPSVDIWTRRDAGSHPVADVQAIAISDLTIVVDGLVEGTQVVESLSEDPTNGDPYDNVDDGTVFSVNVSVPANAVRLVAEITESEAPDIDLYVGTGSTPSAATEVCSSTTPSFAEVCDIADPAAGDWWILVQNWAASDAPPDSTTLVYAVVPSADAGNMTVAGPGSVPELTPFDLRVFWDEPDLEDGDVWYGRFSMGTDAASAGNIGAITVRLTRHPDDVTKTVSASSADSGDVLDYTITVQPNVTHEDLTYTITDTIPDGLTYVEGSATNGAVVTGNVLTWTGTLPTPFGEQGTYVMTTSATDPGCGTIFGTYINLEDLGILINPAIAGDTVGFLAFTGGAPFQYYGNPFNGMGFTDDGFAIFDFANYGGAPWIPQVIPDPSLPNNVAAMLWNDFQIFADAALNHGVSLAVTGEGPTDYAIVEYDDIQLFGGSTATFDFEIQMLRAVDNTPGVYEIVYAYDNLSTLGDLDAFGPSTIGVEDLNGTAAVALLNVAPTTSTLSDGFQVCFDFTGPVFQPEVISYQVTVDADVAGVFTNEVVHDTDNPGSLPATTSTDVLVTGSCGDPITPIYAIQGSGDESPLHGQGVVTEGVVTGDFQGDGQLGGFFIQDATGDGNASTSDGIFVSDFGGDPVAVGDVVRVAATVDEQFGMTQLEDVVDINICGTGSVAPTAVDFPFDDVDEFEPFEGMLITFPDPLIANDTFNLHRFGEVVVANERQFIPTNRIPPGPAAADTDGDSVHDLNEAGRFILDDGSGDQFPDVIPYLAADNTLRLGDSVTDLTGVLGFGFGNYRLHPTEAVAFDRTNPRPALDNESSVRVASFNVRNYWTTIDDGVNDARGADSVAELARQTDKLVAAITALNADIVGLQELENNGPVAIGALVDALNAATAAGTWAAVPDPAYPGGLEATNAIKSGIIYQPGSVTRVGDSVADDAAIFSTDRPPIAQTFAAGDSVFTVVVNHFKSKGDFEGNAAGLDLDLGDGQAFFNNRRVLQAQAVLEFVEELQAASGDQDVLVIGDLNANAMEDPIVELESGMVNLMDEFIDPDDQYSFVFFGQAELFDYAFSTPGLAGAVTDVTIWHINADEPRVLDFNDAVIDPAESGSSFNQEFVYNPDEWRSSDHDPVIVTLDFVPDDVGLFDPDTGAWHLRNAGGPPTSFFFGNPGDDPMMGDWNGNGVDTPGLFRSEDGFVYLRLTNSQGVADITFFAGNPDDIAIAGDFDGDGFDTVSIYRPDEARVYIFNSLGADGGGIGTADFFFDIGDPGDVPFVGDFDGDGIDTVGIYRDETGEVAIRNSLTTGPADVTFFFGDPGDLITFGDWLANGPDTPAVFRSDEARFYLRHSNTQGPADANFFFGESGWLPVSGRFGLS